jgi:serine/threonine protein kinase
VVRTVTGPAGSVDGVLAGRYRLDERIAVGGMGEVWRGLDTLLGRPVAVKCLKPEYVGHPEFSERFRAEARHAAGLSHPGIASVYDYGEQTSPEPAAWLVMELVEGEPLSALLHREGALDPAQALDIVGQAAMALSAAHVAGVVHRDVKPGNLLVRPDGVVKVTDFGIARAVDAVPITRTGTVMGTAYYLSPEQASGRPVTFASDVYSLGAVAYECLAGRRPFPGDNPLAVASAHVSEPPPPLPVEIPQPVRDLVLRALEKDPAQRPQNAGELGQTALALKASLATRPDQTMVLPTAEQPTIAQPPLAQPVVEPLVEQQPAAPQAWSGRALAAAAVLALVVLLGLGVRAALAPDDPDTSTASGTPSPSAASSPSARTVTVVASAWIGKPAAQVRDGLLALGLKPTYAYDGTGGPAGTVRGVSPTGVLAYGSGVRISVVPTPSPAPAKAPAERPRKHGKGGK